MKLDFSRHIFEKTQVSNPFKIRPVGAELFHAGGRTETTKIIVSFRYFANAPKKKVMARRPRRHRRCVFSACTLCGSQVESKATSCGRRQDWSYGLILVV
jgi:hypothetical protein